MVASNTERMRIAAAIGRFERLILRNSKYRSLRFSGAFS